MLENDGRRPHIYSYLDPDTGGVRFVNDEALDNFVRNGLDGARWAYLEREMGDDCVVLKRLDAAVPSAYTSGRAFGVDYELRWRSVAPGVFGLQLLTEQTVNWDGFVEVPYPFDPIQPDPYHILLVGTLAGELKGEHTWGGNEDPVWIETRIPRTLEYPVTVPTKQVAVLAYDYCVNGITVATRWLSLEGVTS